MVRLSRARLRLVRAAACAGLAGFVLSAGPALGASTPASASAPAKESIATFQSQLAGGHVHAVVVRTKQHKLHVTLNGGRKVAIVYVPSEQQALIAQIEARGVSVKVVKPKSQSGLRSHHKLRYIAAGLVIVVIVIVVAVFLIMRRRRRREEEQGY